MFIFKKGKLKKEAVNKNWKIKRDCLDLIYECAKSQYPNEFGGLLRIDLDKRDTIIEIVILPGTISGESHAIFKMHMLPIDFSIVGSVHSHPSRSYYPSKADLQNFRKHGKIHIITANPYNENSWRAFDQYGNEINIQIV